MQKPKIIFIGAFDTKIIENPKTQEKKLHLLITLFFFWVYFFAVLQLCYNKLSGSIPTQLGSLKKITVLALQYNQLSGAIPASLGDINTLTRLDLSFNNLFGPVPVKLAGAPLLEVLDIRNNSFSGFVPSGNNFCLLKIR